MGNKKLKEMKITEKHGQENFTYEDMDLGINLLDFWRWSASDLVSNAQRGILAEFIVGSALQCIDNPRTEWDAYDLISRNGLTIEVKSASYIQSWYQNEYSKITFGIQPTKGWNSKTNITAKDAKRQADVYVFCLLHHKDKRTINPLQLDQCEFYILDTDSLNTNCNDQKSLSLSRLQMICGSGMTYDQMKEAFKARYTITSEE